MGGWFVHSEGVYAAENRYSLKVDLKQAQKLLNALDSNSSNFTFQTFDDNRARKNGALVRTFKGSLAEHAEALVALNESGAAVAVGVNDTGDRERTNANVGRCRAVWCDYDQTKTADRYTLEVIVKKSPLAPSITVRSSSDNYHFYWVGS